MDSDKLTQGHIEALMKMFITVVFVEYLALKSSVFSALSSSLPPPAQCPLLLMHMHHGRWNGRLYIESFGMEVRRDEYGQPYFMHLKILKEKEKENK